MTRRMPADIADAPKKSVDEIFKKAIIIVPILFLAIAAIFGAIELPSISWGWKWLGYDIDGIPVLMMPVALGAYLITIYLLHDKWKEISEVFITAIFLLVVMWLYKTSQMDVGHRRDFIYFVAFSIAIMVLFAPDHKGKKTARVLGVLAFSILGISHFASWEQLHKQGSTVAAVVEDHIPSPPSLPSPPPVSRTSTTTTAGVPNGCPGKPEVYVLTSARLTRISNSPCKLRVAVGSSCVLVYGESRQVLGRTCAHTEDTINGIGYYLSAENVPTDVTVTRWRLN